jgi:predicted HTH transcriptional regulator
MTTEELQTIIDQGENAKVDFKRQWYKKEDIKGEFVKDMLALGNGDIHSIDKMAYLIIGIEDKNKNFFEFEAPAMKSPSRFVKEILQNLNNYSQPEFTSLEVEWVEYGKGDVLVFSIKPQGRLISLSKNLKLKNGTDKKGTVYYRVGESIRVASADVIRDFEKAFAEKTSKGGTTINIHGDVNGIANVSGGHVEQTLNFTKS